MTIKSIYLADIGDLLVKSDGCWLAESPSDAIAAAKTVGFFGADPVAQQDYPGADLKTDYAAGDLDSEAEVILAINATNSMLNSLRSALINLGLVASEEEA